jgi:hypothetical protein
LVGIVKDESLFHGLSLWWLLVPKLRLVDMLFYHNFLFLKFFFFFLNVVSRILSNGPLNLCIKWKDSWIFGAKPLHELDEVLPSTAASVLLFGWSLKLRSIAPKSMINRNALDNSWPALDRNHRNYIATELKQCRKTEKII